jgi:hypothetical protein
VIMTSGGAHTSPVAGRSSASPSASAAPTATPTDAPTATLTETPIPTDAPTAVPTEAGTPWDVFAAYASAQTDKQIADNQAWNKASNPSTTFAAATKMKADAQADLAWLKANPPLTCYTPFYNDMVAYDNQNIKGMNDWFSGRYSAFNNVDQPALKKIWLRLDTEFSDAVTACS